MALTYSSMLPLGTKLIPFDLPNTITGQTFSSTDIEIEQPTLIMIICNHCPYVIAIAERLSFEAKELKKLSINMIAIMSNDVEQYPEDSFNKMKLFAKKYDFEFSYLYDETQEVAKSYGAVCTPDIFGFNSFKGKQLEIIKNLLDGKDSMVIMPTGGGKSMCYQLPALISDGIAIVILLL